MSGGTGVKTVFGIDFGSRNVKTCLMEDCRIVSLGCFETMEFYRTRGAVRDGLFTVDLSSLGIGRADSVVATGYGRTSAQVCGARIVSELTAHFHGARFQTGLDDFTLLDMGGQDYKVIRASGGVLSDFAANDKCAASTGRYLENMARVLGITLDELGSHSADPVPLSDTCAIFGESEIIGHIVRGESVARLAAGVNRTVAGRVLPLLERMGAGVIVMSGGVALNRAVKTMLEEMTGRETLVVEHPLHNGAVGCCIYGNERGAVSA
jgi:(R)-2-hydroxyacyl-CoA dehydratese activating ATPase